MENSLKQRIVGAVVLIALAVIFLPPLLKKSDNQREFESKIPPQPEQIAILQNQDATDRQAKSKQDDSVVAVNTSDSDSSNTRTNKILADKPQQVAKSETAAADNSNADKKGTESPSNSTHAARARGETKTKREKQVGKASVSAGSAESTEKTRLSAAYRSAAWVVQVASFSDKANAKRLVSKLKKAGFKAYRRDTHTGQKSLSRVFVGPYIEKSRATKDLPKINKAAAVKGLVRVYDPVKD